MNWFRRAKLGKAIEEEADMMQTQLAIQEAHNFIDYVTDRVIESDPFLDQYRKDFDSLSDLQKLYVFSYCCGLVNMQAVTIKAMGKALEELQEESDDTE